MGKIKEGCIVRCIKCHLPDSEYLEIGALYPVYSITGSGSLEVKQFPSKGSALTRFYPDRFEYYSEMTDLEKIIFNIIIT